jgi:hypothetical protein
VAFGTSTWQLSDLDEETRPTGPWWPPDHEVQVSGYVDATDAGVVWMIDLKRNSPGWEINRVLKLYADDGPDGGIDRRLPTITLTISHDLVEQLPGIAKELLDLPIPPKPWSDGSEPTGITSPK